jgi:hypothetical protein
MTQKPRIYMRDGQWRADLRHISRPFSLDTDWVLKLRFWLMQMNKPSLGKSG